MAEKTRIRLLRARGDRYYTVCYAAIHIRIIDLHYVRYIKFLKGKTLDGSIL